MIVVVNTNDYTVYVEEYILLPHQPEKLPASLKDRLPEGVFIIHEE